MEGSTQENNLIIPSVAQRALNDFNANATKIIEENMEGMSQRPVPQIIYHYSTDLGLRGILQSRALWLTDMFSLNDPSELSYGYEHAVRFLAETAKMNGRDFQNNFASAFGNNPQKKFRESAHFFCCSFSEAHDDLGQWRAYANNGDGYALGFDAEKLKEAFTAMAYSSPFRVCYDEKLLRETCRKVIDLFSPLLNECEAFGFQEIEEFRQYCRQIQMALARQILPLCLHFKHPAYNNESEYRFLKTQKTSELDGIRYRPRNHELVKYIEFDWSRAGTAVLKKIVIGPAANKEKSRDFVQQCLTDAALTDVEIICSPIPYRTVFARQG